MTKRALVLLLVAVLGCAACQPPYVGPKGTQRVGVVGDSITAYSTPEIQGALGRYQRSVIGIPGIDLPNGLSDLVVPLAISKPDVAVVELGVNSAEHGAWTTDKAAYIDKILAVLSGVRCVVWVLPTSLPVSFYDQFGPGSLQGRVALVYKALQAQVASHPNLHIFNYGTTEQEHPDWYVKDHLHPTDTGKLELAGFISSAIKSACPA